MIIFGTRFIGKQDLLTTYGTCEKCGAYGPQRNYTGRRWAHVYWIPLIPMEQKTRVMKECASCKHAWALPVDQIEKTVLRTREVTDKALASLLAGKETVDVNGVATDPVNEIGGSLDFLLSLGESNYVHLLVAALRQKPECAYACSVCEALWAEFEGDLDSAEEHYRAALRISTRSPMPATSLARLYMHRQKHDEAEAILEQILSATGDAGLHGLMAQVRTRKGDADGAAKSYEAFFRATPGAAQDKGLYKDYRKACKKAGRKPLSNF